MAAVLRTRERSMLPRIKPGNGGARLMGGGAHGDTRTHQTQARALQCSLAAPTPAVHGGEDRESGLRGGGPRLAPSRKTWCEVNVRLSFARLCVHTPTVRYLHTSSSRATTLR